MPDTKYVSMTVYMFTTTLLVGALSGLFGMFLAYRDDIFDEIREINVSVGKLETNVENIDDKLNGYNVEVVK